MYYFIYLYLTTSWVSCMVAFFTSVRAAASSLASACCSGGIVLINICKYYKTETENSDQNPSVLKNKNENLH